MRLCVEGCVYIYVLYVCVRVLHGSYGRLTLKASKLQPTSPRGTDLLSPLIQLRVGAANPGQDLACVNNAPHISLSAAEFQEVLVQSHG